MNNGLPTAQPVEKAEWSPRLRASFHVWYKLIRDNPIDVANFAEDHARASVAAANRA